MFNFELLSLELFFFIFFTIHLHLSIFVQRAMFPIHPSSSSPTDAWKGGRNWNRAGAQKISFGFYVCTYLATLPPSRFSFVAAWGMLSYPLWWECGTLKRSLLSNLPMVNCICLVFLCTCFFFFLFFFSSSASLCACVLCFYTSCFLILASKQIVMLVHCTNRTDCIFGRFPAAVTGMRWLIDIPTHFPALVIP